MIDRSFKEVTQAVSSHLFIWIVKTAGLNACHLHRRIDKCSSSWIVAIACALCGS